MKRQLALTLLVFAILWSNQVQAQKSLSTTEAKEHVGEKATVCGDVVITHYAVKTSGGPTFINLDKSYPDQVFTVLIWGSVRPKFGNPEAYRSKHICVTGKISD